MACGNKAKYFDVQKDGKKLQEMLLLTGNKRVVPVLVEDGKTIIGYGGT